MAIRMSSLSSGVIGLILAYFYKIGGTHKVRTHMASDSMPIGRITNAGYAAIRANNVNMKNIKNNPPKNVDIRSFPLFILYFFLLLSYSMPTYR